MIRTDRDNALIQIARLDAKYEDTQDAILFWRREAYLAKTASPYVRRSQLDTITALIAKREQERDDIFSEIERIKDDAGLTWDDVVGL